MRKSAIIDDECSSAV